MLGTRFETQRDAVSGEHTQVAVTNKFMYVPILQALQSVYKNEHILGMLSPENCGIDGKQ